ncbi:MAG: IS110 family transposase [Verrucomicrobiales bacterium]
MKNTIPSTTIGLDLGDKKHSVCVLNADGEIIDERTITNHRESLRRLSLKYPGARIAHEVGSHSPWISRFLKELGHEVIVANPRKLRAIYASDRKSDRNDARMLARIARLDPQLLYPVQHGSEEAQRDLLQIKLRDNLVRQRVDIISSVRFTLKSMGRSLPSPNTQCFAKRCRTILNDSDAPLLTMIEPSLQVIDLLTKNIRELDRAIERLCDEKYPHTRRLRQVMGVGAITSLSFVLTIEDPERFRQPRDVAAYLGLVPKRDQSGGLDKQLRISKAGDAYLRRLLVGAAQYILGPFGPDTDLRRHGLALAERGGARAKKKAVVAIARKLSVLLLVLWKHERDYEPQRLVNLPQAA